MMESFVGIKFILVCAILLVGISRSEEVHISSNLSTICYVDAQTRQTVLDGISTMTAQLTDLNRKVDLITESKASAQCQEGCLSLKTDLDKATTRLNRVESELSMLLLERTVQRNEIQALKKQVALTSSSSSRHVKQYAWKKEDSTDNGVIKTVSFPKIHNSSALWVQWDGNLRVLLHVGTPEGCSRWFFTIDGQECKDPATLDAVYYAHADTKSVYYNVHNPSSFGGLCMGVPSGDLKVALHVGTCPGTSYPLTNAHTGWVSTSRIIIEEIDV